MVDGDADTQAMKNWVIRSEPFLAECQRSGEDAGVGVQQRWQRAATVEVDDSVGEWLDGPSLGTED